MYEAPGIGLAAPQVGVQKRMFVYDIGDGAGPHTVINPSLEQSAGRVDLRQGCLSVPGLYWPIERAKKVHLTGLDLDGNEVDIEADDLLARCSSTSVDHLDGILLLERLTKDQRKEAMRELRRRERSDPSSLEPVGVSRDAGGGGPVSRRPRRRRSRHRRWL